MKYIILWTLFTVFALAKLTPLQLAMDINEFSKEKRVSVSSKFKVYSKEELTKKATSYSKAIGLFMNNRFKVATIQDGLTLGESAPKTQERELIAFFIGVSDAYQNYPIKTRLDVLKAVKSAMRFDPYKPYWENLFNLSGILQTEFRWTDRLKDIKKQIETLKYLLNHYEKYKELYIYNYADVPSHTQPDVWAEFFIEQMQFDLEGYQEAETFLKEYSKLYRELYTKARKDITYYKYENVKKVLADKKSKRVHPYFQKIYDDMKARYDKGEYFWFESLSCRDEQNNYIYKYVPNYEKGKTSLNGRFTKYCFSDRKTPFTGVLKDYYNNGEVKYNYPYKDGFKHGVYKSYHKNGMVEQEGEYKEGLPIGTHKIHWEDNKHKLKVTTYKDGLIHTFTNHYSDGSKRFIPYDKYGYSIAKGIKNLDKNGRRDCFDDEHILRYKDYECLIDKYSFNQEIQAIDNGVLGKKLDELLKKAYMNAENLNGVAYAYYKKHPNDAQRHFIKATLGVQYDEQIEKILNLVLLNKNVEFVVYELLKYESLRKGFEGRVFSSSIGSTPREYKKRDERIEEIIKLVKVTLAYKKLHNLKTVKLLPDNLAKNETEYGKKVYQEMQYRLVEFLKNQKGIF